MALVAMSSSPLPLRRRLAPVRNTVVRYSDVAQFVGLSLLHDPKLTQSKRKFKREEVMSRYLEEDDSDTSDVQSAASSQPNLHDRGELLRAKIRHLQAEQRNEKEHLKRLEHTLADTVTAEMKAHTRADRNRQERDQHKDHMKRVGERMHQLRSESRQRSATSGQSGQVSRATSQPSLAAKDRDDSMEPRRRNGSAGSRTTSKTSGSKPATALGESRSKLTLDFLATPKFREMTLEVLESFESEAELLHHQREAVREYLLEHVGDPVQAFKAINVNGSGRISSMEFADGIDRLGIPWKALTGLNKPSDLFRLFAAKKSGVIVFRDFFPAYEEPKDETGYDTPTFWAAYEKEDFAEGHADSDVPKWQVLPADEGLKVMRERERKDLEASFQRKWMYTTMRRMKSQGKSDARCREMVALHLPHGTGPIDLHGVPTISDHDVKQLRQKYLDQMKGPQRKAQQHIYDLHQCRRDLLASKNSFFHVVTEPVLQKKFLEDQAKAAKLALGGLAGGLIHKHDEPIGNYPEDTSPTSHKIDEELEEELAAEFEHVVK